MDEISQRLWFLVDVSFYKGKCGCKNFEYEENPYGYTHCQGIKFD